MNFAKSRVAQSVRHRIYLPFLNFLDWIQDKLRGVKTQKIIELSDLGLDPSVGVRYECVSYNLLKEELLFASKFDYKVFVDIGCGLGRPLIVAEEQGFKDLYGIDISEKLINSCGENLKSKGIKANLSCCDIDDYLLPEGDITIFLFNPFGEIKMRNLINQIEKRNGNSFVIYHNPIFESLFDLKYLVKREEWLHFGLYEERSSFFLFKD